MPSPNADPSPSKLYDIAIVGAGPTGLFAAFYAGLRQMSVLLLDSLEVLGGQCAALYPEKFIYDVAGFPAVLAKDLVAGMVKQALQYQPAIGLGEQVLEIDAQADRKLLLRTSRRQHRAHSVIIAGGVGAFVPRKLALDGAERFEGRGLYYFVADPAQFAAKRILIVGGGDSAVDWANALAPLAAQLTLIHRRDQFRAHEDSVAKMHQSAARILAFHELHSIDGDGHVQRATIFDNRAKTERSIDVDAVLVNIGFSSSLGPIANWGLELEGAQIKVDGMMQTNRPGIFAAGDICTYAGKLKLLATGFGEACIAVNYAKHYLDPRANIFPGHSTNLQPPPAGYEKVTP